ncbi:hypothetical protein [Candidatus Amarobacter glycogenicus]|uniref:hypothetical protein n=1 Tax=Candidatus Amarobacter glycogenicus TaxID=3140699 RepID=UPI0031CCBF50
MLGVQPGGGFPDKRSDRARLGGFFGVGEAVGIDDVESDFFAILAFEGEGPGAEFFSIRLRAVLRAMVKIQL